MKIKEEFIYELLQSWVWRIELGKHNFTIVVEILLNTGIITQEQADEAYKLSDKIILDK